MKNPIKRTVAFMLALVLIFAVLPCEAFASQNTATERQNACVSPEAKLLSSVVNVAELKAYLTKEFSECNVDISISAFKIPYAYEYMYALNRMMSYDMPESFHFGSAVFWGNGSIYTRISVRYRDFADTREKFDSTKAEFTEAADKLLIGVENEPSLTQAEKALILHDRLAVLNEYDTSEDDGLTPPQSSYSPYGALVKRRSVCQGYALAYMYLLKRAGIDSYYCNSYFLGHAWNIVYIDGKAYHVDVTWDDPVPNVSGYVSHDYFLKSSAGIVKLWQTAWCVDFDNTPTDTTYDSFYWQSSNTQFSLIDKQLYYFDNIKRTLNTVKNGKPSVIMENVGDFNSRLSDDGNSILLSSQKTIYKINTANGSKSVFYVPPVPYASCFQILGFEYSPEYLLCDVKTEIGTYKTIKIADGVESIAPDAYNNIDNLISVELPKSVESIGDNAFLHFSEAYSNRLTVTPTIYGYSSTVAENYAEENSLDFVSLGKKEAHTHSYTVKSAIAPTCTCDGKRTYLCSCGEEYSETMPAAGHRIVTDAAVKATCTRDGKTAGEHCADCGKITVAQKTVKATGHRYKTVTASASLSKEGRSVTKCSVCQTVKSTSVIPKVKTVSLSKNKFVYNGKTQRPTVTVKDSKGKTLKNGTDYTLKYSGGKYVGKYTVTITLKGKYSGTKTLNYSIVPKGTNISKLTAGKKSFTVKWAKQTAQTSGYEIQYSLKSSMSGAKAVTVAENKSTSASVKNLKSGKKYYVRIRTYKTVRMNGKSVKLYSSWSDIRNIKTR